MKGKRFLAMLVALVWVCGVFPVAHAAEYRDPLRYGWKALQQMDNAASLLYAYDRMVEGVAVCDASISLDGGAHSVKSEDLSAVYLAVLNDYPEYFWLGKQYFYTTADGEVCDIEPKYTVSGAALTQAKTALSNRVAQLTSGVSGTDYDKAKLLHDRLAAAVTYESGEWDQTAYGALVDGKAVCAGYANAYQLLLRAVGIPAWTVIGSSVNPTTGNPESHAWNIVSLDGAWYHTDVTWDDQGDTEKDVFYAYFNLTTAQIAEGHTVTEFAPYLPKATATAANYFVKNGGIFSTFSLDTFVAQLKADKLTTRVYVTGDADAFADAFYGNIETIAKRLGITTAYSYGYRQLGRELILSVTPVSAGHTHALTAVKAKAATCHSVGNTAYYTCKCGMWFSDAAAKQPIADHSRVVIAATAHKASGWKHDSHGHWKVCVNAGCDAIIADTNETHAYKNGACAVCGAASATVAATNAAKTTKKQTRSTTSASVTQSTASTTKRTTGGDSSHSQADAVTDAVTNATDSDPSEAQTTMPTAVAGPHVSDNTLFLYCLLGVVLLTFLLSVAAVILSYRRNRKR